MTILSATFRVRSSDLEMCVEDSGALFSVGPSVGGTEEGSLALVFT